jgi:hypothetical protein
MKDKHVSPIFLSNHSSATLVIPHKMAESLQIDKPCNVILQEKLGGILIKKLKV